MEQSSFDATISALNAESALDVETSAFGAATSAITRRSFDVTISDAETSALGDIDAEFPAISSIVELVSLRRCVTELLIMEI